MLSTFNFHKLRSQKRDPGRAYAAQECYGQGRPSVISCPQDLSGGTSYAVNMHNNLRKIVLALIAVLAPSKKGEVLYVYVVYLAY